MLEEKNEELNIKCDLCKLPESLVEEPKAEESLNEVIEEPIEEECCGKCKEDEPEIYISSFNNNTKRNLFLFCLVCVIIIIIFVSLKY